MLYPTELRAEIHLLTERTRHLEVSGIKKDGRGERIRTSGLLLPKQALYQAKLHPENPRFYPKLSNCGNQAFRLTLCDVVTLGFHHDPQEWFGARSTNQHPARFT